MRLSKESGMGPGYRLSQPDKHSALLLIDLQNDFFPGGALEVPGSDTLIPTINAYIRHFSRNGWPILATRDWHPPDHCSFIEQQGTLPVHCVQGSKGAQFHSELVLPPGVMVISKGTHSRKDSGSCFEESSLEDRLEDVRSTTLFILGLDATGCLQRTVAEACRLKLNPVILIDAVKMSQQPPASSKNPFEEAVTGGAVLAEIKDFGISLL